MNPLPSRPTRVVSIRPLRRALLLGAAASTLALAGCDRLAAMFGGSGAGFHGVDITGAGYARDFSLPDPQGQVRSLGDYRGKVVVVFFGFTQCPDVCPTTMTEMAQVRDKLGADGERVQTVFITVDPERDTPEILAAYLSNFGSGFVGLRGTPEQTAATAKEFRVFYSKQKGRTPDSYTIDHTAASFVFDPKGQVRLYVRYGTEVEALASDLRRLLGGA